MNIESYRKAGYTHIISWKEYHELFGIYVPKSFPTTDDAVDLYINALKGRREDDNIIRIKVTRI